MACCVLMAVLFAGVLGVNSTLFGRRNDRAQSWRLDGDPK